MFKPSYRYEKKYWRQGKNMIVGIDEVGRGALAGPLVVAGVIFSHKIFLKNIF